MAGKATITGYSVSTYLAKAGDTITVDVTVKNIGNDFAWFYAECADPVPPVEEWGVSPAPYYHGLDPNQSGKFTFAFLMPSAPLVFYIAAMRWSGSDWVEDDRTGSIPISLQGGGGLPFAKVWQTSLVPATAEVGSVVNIDVTLKNEGQASGLLQPWVRESNVGFEGYSPQPFWAEVAPGSTALFRMRFTMPAYDVGFWLVACHWEADWMVDEWHNYYVIAPYSQGQVRSLDCNYVRAA